MKILLPALLLIGSVVMADEANWSTTLAEDPVDGGMACLMMSRSRIIEDGQTTTPVRIVYNGRAFLVTTRSNVDLSYPGLGLTVDGRQHFDIDGLHGKTAVLFETRAGALRDAFIGGREARLTLGFWPSWPKTRSVTTGFSLMGFTRAHEAFERCVEKGELSPRGGEQPAGPAGGGREE